MDILIQKVVVDCDVAQHSQPSQAGRVMERFLKHKLLPAVEDILNELPGKYSQIVLDKASMEMDLTGAGATFENIPASTLRSMLKPQILAYISEKAEHKPAWEGLWEQFIFIITWGYKPRSFNYKSHYHFEQVLLANLPSLKGNTSSAGKIKGILPEMNYIQRISAVHSSEFVVKLLKTLYDNIAYSEEQILSDVNKITPLSSHSGNFVSTYILLVAALYSFTKKNEATAAGIPENIKKVFRSLSGISQSEYKRIPSLEIKELQSTLQTLLKRGKRIKYNSDEGKGKDATENTRTKPGIQDHAKSDESERPWKDEGVYMHNAGLVILAYFLPNFFTRLGYLKEQQLSDPHQCVYLLQMLCGAEEDKEYDLVLNKILCGLEPEENLKRQKKIRKKDIKEGKLLLNSVVAHWTALKNTSAEALQYTFLLREGKLFQENETVTLQVERKTEDVLLDFLPWSIGLIKLPWMKYPVAVKWNNRGQ